MRPEKKRSTTSAKLSKYASWYSRESCIESLRHCAIHLQCNNSVVFRSFSVVGVLSKLSPVKMGSTTLCVLLMVQGELIMTTGLAHSYGLFKLGTGV